MKTKNYLLLSALAFGLFNCVQPPDYPNEPEISYIGFNKLSIAQGNQDAPPDTLILMFSFTDGDGDLGNDTDSIDIFYTDSRDGFRGLRRLPVIPDQGTGNGISGEVTLKFPNKPFNICCTYPDGATACQPNPNFATDTFSYTLQIRDRAGNFSNEIQTETVTILCN